MACYSVRHKFHSTVCYELQALLITAMVVMKSLRRVPQLSAYKKVPNCQSICARAAESSQSLPMTSKLSASDSLKAPCHSRNSD